MSNNNTTTPSGLATSQQVKALTETLGMAGIRWRECEHKVILASQRLEETVNTFNETRSHLASAKSDLDAALEYGSGSEIVEKHMEQADSEKVRDDINAIRNKLDSLSFPDITPVRQLIQNLGGAIEDWKKEKYQMTKKINELLPLTTAHELSKEYAETRKNTKLSGYYWGIAATLAVYTILAIVSIFNNKLAGIYIPLLPFSAVLYLFIQQITQKTRMDEEYRHKETMMKTYVGFSQSEQLAEEKKAELDQSAIESVKRNPAETISSAGWLRK